MATELETVATAADAIHTADGQNSVRVGRSRCELASESRPNRELSSMFRLLNLFSFQILSRQQSRVVVNSFQTADSTPRRQRCKCKLSIERVQACTR